MAGAAGPVVAVGDCGASQEPSSALIIVASLAALWLLPLLACLPKAWRGMVNDLLLLKRDPALHHIVEAFFAYPGLWALWWYRLSHGLFVMQIPVVSWFIPRLTMSVVRYATAVDIHPAAKLSDGGILIDHATGVVIGATAVVGARTTIYHQVTLGATGKTVKRGDRRHPIVGADCMLGTGCKILGAITVGNGCLIGANSVVTRDVPDGGTAVGIPARLLGQGAKAEARADHDTSGEAIRNLHERLSLLEVFVGPGRETPSQPATPQPQSPTIVAPIPVRPESDAPEPPSPSSSPEIVPQLARRLSITTDEKKCAVSRYWTRLCNQEHVCGFHGLSVIMDSLNATDDHEHSFASAAL